MASLDIVVGGLYGSEAKGHVTQRLVEHRLSESAELWNIRVGGPNAGHTGHDPDGRPWAFRQIPVGVLVSDRVNLAIGAGSEIDLPVLLDEIDRCKEANLLQDGRLYVHAEATLIEDQHKRAETALVGAIGSTGKGIGAARADRLMRRAQRLLDNLDAMRELDKREVQIVTGEWEIDGADVVIEGTQGYALGLHSGFYPQCTTSNCRAVDFLSMAGISPWAYDQVTPWVVARVYPIRVAGNSGPMKNERSWVELGLPEERTTVTKKVRRVGLPDWELVRDAVIANGVSNVRVALTMVDQMYPEIANVPYSPHHPQWARIEASLVDIEEAVDAPVSMVASGPNTAAFR